MNVKRVFRPRVLAVIALAAMLVMSIAPAINVASANSGATAIITNAYYLNVRTGPGVGYSVVTVLARGTYVTMLGRNANASWVKVQPIDGSYWQGWVNAFYLAPSMNIWNLPIVDGAQPVPPPPGATGIITNAFYLNARTGPGVGFPVVTVLARGTGVNLVGRNAAGTWLNIEPTLPSQWRAWVNAYYVATSYPISSLPITDGTQPQPGPRTHVVQHGENLFRISLLYGTTVQAIAAANNIFNPNLIYVGQRLIIP